MAEERAERRGRSRVPYSGLVSINNCIMVKAVDISPRGIFLHTGRSFKPGTLVQLAFRLGHDQITTTAIVRFDEVGVGMGLMFVGMADAQRAAVDRYVVARQNRKREELPAAKKRVLIVDPDDSSERIYRSALTGSGYAVLSFKALVAATASLASGERPDVLVVAVDAEKPAVFKGLASFLQAAVPLGVPSLVISPNSLPDTGSRVIAAGATEFLPRSTAFPNRVADLLSKLLAGWRPL